MAHIQRLLTEGKGFGPLDTSLSCLFAINIKGNSSSLGEPTTVVLELHPHLMFAGRNGFGTLDISPFETEKVVAEFWLALFGVETPAARNASDGDDDSFRSRLRYFNLGGNGVRFVRHIDHRQRRHTRQATVNDLSVLLDQLGTSRYLGIPSF